MKQMEKIFMSLVFLFLFRFVGISNAQQTQYPISQLGKCRDGQECYYYCEIPRNSPACWSFGKYILHKDVLGDTTKSPEEIAKEHGIKFPITELGNCNSPQACMEYCNVPANQQACTDFGRKKGLIQDTGNTQQYVNEEKVLSDAKDQLGCSSKDACMAFCNDPTNQQKCQQFAQSEGINQHQSGQQNGSQPSIPSAVFQATKQELGCDSQTTCMDYCSSPDHYQKCQQFAQQHNLIPEQSPPMQQIQHSSTFPSGMPTLPCTDQASCMQWCKDNPEKCQQYNHNQQQGYPTYSPNNSYQPAAVTPSQQYQGTYSPQPMPSSMGGCTTEQNCYQYCQQDPSRCPGFQQGSQN